MNLNPTMLKGRRWFLSSVGIAAGASVSAAATAKESPRDFAPARHKEDAWLNELPGSHRVVIDSATATGGILALGYASNILSAHVDGYHGSESDYALVVCLRRQSTPFGYSDGIWKKYGEALSQLMEYHDPNAGKPFAASPANISNSSDPRHQGIAIDALAAKGVRFAICQRATQGISSALARSTGGSASELYDELIASAIPNGRFMAAGVIATTRAQEYGYSLLSAG